MFPCFTFFGCFHVLPFSGVSMFHLPQVFSFFNFLGCFHFHLSGMFPCFTFLGWFHFSTFSGVSFFTLFGCFCVAVPRPLQIWESIFYFQALFYRTLLPHIWHNLLLSRLPWGQQFFLEDCRASLWVSKHRPSPSVCLNHAVFGQRY